MSTFYHLRLFVAQKSFNSITWVVGFFLRILSVTSQQFAKAFFFVNFCRLIIIIDNKGCTWLCSGVCLNLKWLLLRVQCFIKVYKICFSFITSSHFSYLLTFPILSVSNKFHSKNMFTCLYRSPFLNTKNMRLHVKVPRF